MQPPCSPYSSVCSDDGGYGRPMNASRNHVTPAMPADIGIVRIHAHTILRATPHFTAEAPRVDPVDALLAPDL